MAISLDLVALRCNKISREPVRIRAPRLPTPGGPSLDNVDWRRIRRDFPWTAPPNFGSHSRHTGRSYNFQHRGDAGRTRHFIVPFDSYHSSLGAPGRLHDWRDGSGSDPSDPGALQRWAIQPRIICGLGSTWVLRVLMGFA